MQIRIAASLFFKDTDLCVEHVSTESLSLIEGNNHFGWLSEVNLNWQVPN